MVRKCPHCRERTTQGTDYPAMLKEAEAGKLTFLCVYCGLPWTPPPDEQRDFADKLRKRIPEQPA